MFKGFYKLRPPTPRYHETWDPSIVLDHLGKLYPNVQLSIEDLAKKTVTLIALVTAHRVQTISKISLRNVIIESSFISIKIPDLLKTSRIGAKQPCLVLPFFTQRLEVCPANALSTYIEKTKDLRGEIEQLFISFKKPHKAVGSQTISRWVKDVLRGSGIDTLRFSAHSTRHASTSSAQRSGISIDLIRKTAGWSGSSSTFARYYQRPIINNDDSTFALSILNT